VITRKRLAVKLTTGQSRRLIVQLTDLNLVLLAVGCIWAWLHSIPFVIYLVTILLLGVVRFVVKHYVQGSQHATIRTNDLLNRPVIQLVNTSIERMIQGRVILVTGAAGSIGSEFVFQLLLLKPKEIVLLDQAESALYNLVEKIRQTMSHELDGTTLSTQLANLTNEGRIRRIVATYQPEFVFHAAAYKHVPLMESHPAEAVQVNVLGTKNIVDAAIEYGVKKFVLISTDKAVNPTSVMGATKRFAEMYVQYRSTHADTQFMTTRFGNVLGSAGSVVSVFQEQIKAGGPITVTHPLIYRYFMTVSEACHLVLEAAAMGKGGEVFVFDMGQPIRIVDLARRMIHLAGYQEGRDMSITFTGLRPGEKLHEEVLHVHETVQPTHNSQIKIARLAEPDPVLIEQVLQRIRLALAESDDRKLIQILKEAIPEYISNNSPFSSLDALPAAVSST
jgi:FlaA1/EpsC-like NDP-sugar epimerase